MNNYAFIDGQNLHLGTKTDGWTIDLARFRVYLREKYNVSIAYYFLGYVSNENDRLYDKIQKAGFILKFKEHSSTILGTKKGNVDTEIVFETMKHLIEEPQMGQIIPVSGDGGYYRMTQFLLQNKKLLKILFPSKKFASSLYRSFGSERYDYLLNVKNHIMTRNEKGS